MGSVVTVVSCVIFEDPAKERVLLGVRRPSPAAPRHPGVLSTPTMRVPEALYASIVPDVLRRTAAADEIVAATGSSSFAIGQGVTMAASSSFAVEALLARKLGVAEHLVESNFVGSATLKTVAHRVVDDVQGTGLAEETEMVTFEVVLSKGAHLVPASTASYSRLLFVEAERIAEALAANDALVVDDTLDPFEVCIDGLCIASAAFMISSPSSDP